MSLANLQLRNAVVEYNGTPITVYGLSANDIAGLVVSQMDSIERIFDIVESQGVKSAADLAKINLASVAQQLMAQAPGFIAHVIAYAAREPEYADKVLHIDAPTQVKLLKEISQLTFNDEAGFREFVGNVVAALRSAKGVVPQSPSNEASLALNGSPNGGSASEQPSLS
ncbi:MAG: phage pre-tape measure protein [Lysobacter sp.]